MKIRPVGAELFYADRQTDMTKLMVAFRNFANAHSEPLVTRSDKWQHNFSYSCYILYSVADGLS
jgi:hypothetical protein